MKTIGTLIIIMLLLSISLATTKPSEEHFKNFVERTFSEEFDKQAGSEKVLNKLLAKGLVTQAKYSTKYTDRTFYATAQTTVGKNELRYIGILGSWFKK